MTSDDQFFLDLLASVPSDLASYGSRVADYIEKHSSSLATELRDAIDAATWIPDSMRPPVRAVSHRFASPAPPESLFAQLTTWISKNRTVVAVLVAFAGTTAILIHRRKKAHARKRRARRDRNGKKREIVVLACSSFHDPLTMSLALDLDRRGYIVYVTVSSTEEDSLVQSESRWDIRPLWMDLTSSVPNPGLDIHPNLEPIRQLISPDSRSPSPGSDKSSQTTSTPPHHTLAGLILLPGSTGYPTGPLTTLPPTDLIDIINTRLLSPILTVQQFLPLLTLAANQAHTNTASTKKSSNFLHHYHHHPPLPPSIILAYPSIPTSLHPPHQISETLTNTSLSSFSHSLHRELHSTTPISITELKLGLFDLSSSSSALPRPQAGEYVYPRSYDQGSQPSRNSALTHWHSSQRAAAAQRSLHDHPQMGSGDATSSRSGSGAGSSLRDFHNAVFDTLNPNPGFKAFGVVPWGGSGSGKGRRGAAHTTIYAGQGARLYDLIGKWVPDGLIGWMLRRQEVRREREAAPDAQREVPGTKSASCGTGGENKEVQVQVQSQKSQQERGLAFDPAASSASSGSEVWEKI